jgi:hypothetical protein
VPPQHNCLIGAVYPWSLPDTRFKQAGWSSVGSVVHDRHITHSLATTTDDLALKDPALYRSLSLLRFPRLLVDFLTRLPGARCCLWDMNAHNGSSDGALDMDTRALQIILRKYKGKLMKPSERADIIFIHIGALSTIYRLPMLNDRRAKEPQLRVVTYGAHYSVPTSHWGVREIWPLGEYVNDLCVHGLHHPRRWRHHFHTNCPCDEFPRSGQIHQNGRHAPFLDVFPDAVDSRWSDPEVRR